MPGAAPAVRALGRVDYAPTWQAMRAFTLARTADTPDELWIVEHAPVFTLGQAGRRDHLLDAGDIPVVPTDRGGQVTYHGPGQVVVYVLVDLRRLGIYVKELVFRIEQAVVQVLAAYGVDGRRVAGAPGVYVPMPVARATVPAAAAATASRGAEAAVADFAGLAKIAALGIKVTHGCSYHGVSLNVAMDLGPFLRIDPCGYSGLAVTDLRALGVAAEPADAGARLAARLATHLRQRDRAPDGAAG
jgi:lipoyl(octanoyl) transferase